MIPSRLVLCSMFHESQAARGGNAGVPSESDAAAESIFVRSIGCLGLQDTEILLCAFGNGIDGPRSGKAHPHFLAKHVSFNPDR